MKVRHQFMHPIRLAYATEFLLALIAVYLLWRQVGGASHFEALPWYVTGSLISAASFSAVKATAEAVSHEAAWNAGTVKWCAILAVLLAGCGMASYYAHNHLESDELSDEDALTSLLLQNPESCENLSL